MARFDMRVFGGKAHLLVFPENEPERELLQGMFRKKPRDGPPTPLEGSLQLDDFHQPYVRISRKIPS
jgi:hypothetical protein